MFTVRRSPHNPILIPNQKNPWEAYATFNPCPIKVGKATHLLYRAITHPEKFENQDFLFSSIGKAVSKDGKKFGSRIPFIEADRDWDRYGCEDPRVTNLGRKYYIFYTALSTFPFSAEGIRVGLATSTDMETIDEKHLITPFNAKAMSLFPEKINGKYTAILTAHTDKPPAKIAIAQFDKEEDMWSQEYWHTWLKNIDKHSLDLKRENSDQIEVGGPPVKTKHGWLLVYCHIANYFTKPEFGIEAVLLDLKNPRKMIARTRRPMLVPEESYEKFGTVPNIVFPSGCLIEGDMLKIYYGGADTVCVVAEVNLENLLHSMREGTQAFFVRSHKNPILMPTDNEWEKRAVFNPAAIELDGKIHLVYRAMSEDNTSTFGYASTNDGIKIKTRSSAPIYVPREQFESKGMPNGNSGCEDPRITKIKDKLYMCYTAFNGLQPPAVALSVISEKDFLRGAWSWSKPVLVSPPGVDDKDACIVPVSKGGKYLFLHRIDNSITASMIDIDRPEPVSQYVPILKPRPGMWDGKKVGLSAPPVLTKHGWLMIYHGVSEHSTYRVGLALFDADNPINLIARTTDFVFEPIELYEKVGQVNNVVFPCSTVIRGRDLYIYYGGGDSVVGVAVAKLQDIFRILLD